MSSATVAYSPQLLAEVHTKLAQGPLVERTELGSCPHSRIVLVWRELPSRLAAVLAMVSGVLFLMVSPTAPYAVNHAEWLLRTQVSIDAGADGELPEPIPVPRRSHAMEDGNFTAALADKRRTVEARSGLI